MHWLVLYDCVTASDYSWVFTILLSCFWARGLRLDCWSSRLVRLYFDGCLPDFLCGVIELRMDFYMISTYFGLQGSVSLNYLRNLGNYGENTSFLETLVFKDIMTLNLLFALRRGYFEENTISMRVWIKRGKLHIKISTTFTKYGMFYLIFLAWGDIPSCTSCILHMVIISSSLILNSEFYFYCTCLWAPVGSIVVSGSPQSSRLGDFETTYITYTLITFTSHHLALPLLWLLVWLWDVYY